MARTRQFVGADDIQYDFFTREDLEAEFPGIINDVGEYDGDLVNAAFMTWFQSGQSSCLFAQRFARNAEDFGWHLTCITDHTDPSLERELNTLMEGLHPGTQVTFPLVRTVEEVADLVVRVGDMELWTAERIRRDDDHADEISRIGLRCRMDDAHVAWALGFAPIGSMPITRQAPYTALILRSRVEYDSDAIPRTDPSPDIGIHLADMCRADEINQGVWKNTEKMRRNLVGEVEYGAKARVTFSLPADLLPPGFGEPT